MQARFSWYSLGRNYRATGHRGTKCRAFVASYSRPISACATAVFLSTAPFRTSARHLTAAGFASSRWPKGCWHTPSTLSAYLRNILIYRIRGPTGPFSISTEAATSSAPASPIAASSHISPRLPAAVPYFLNTALPRKTCFPPAFWTPAPPTGFSWLRAIRPTA